MSEDSGTEVPWGVLLPVFYAQVHYLGYELGDLSLSSFIVDGDGRLWLGSVIGSVNERNSKNNFGEGESDARFYLAPEIRINGGVS